MSDQDASHCAECCKTFTVDAAHLAFLELVSPTIGGQRQIISKPRLCADCRLQRRLAFRNPSTVAWRQCAVSGKKIISAYPNAELATIIENDIWWGDSWSALDYGRSFDSARSFLSQFQDLRNAVPFAARIAARSENCDYTSNINDSKNCYFVFNTLEGEDCLYCDYVWWGKDCIDCTRGVRAELCYDCVETPNCYNLQSSEFCSDCRDSIFLSQCRSCSDCFSCWNLSRKRFCVNNVQLSEQQYREYLVQLNLSSYSARMALKVNWISLKSNAPRPHMYGIRVEESQGNYLANCNRVRDSFFIIDAEDVRFGFVLNNGVKNAYDFSHFGGRSENVYECQTVGHGAFQMLFCRDCVYDNSDLMYCASCYGCHDCFGCVGLRNKRYCVLNREYSKEDYEALVVGIISRMRIDGEWGEFFPISTSPFPYNVSFAARYFPLSEAEAQLKNLSWYHAPDPEASGAQKTDLMPDQLPESDTSLIVKSAVSGRPFRITTQEIQIYRKLNVPLPRASYAERMEERWRQLGGIEMLDRETANGQGTLLSSLDSNVAPVLWDKESWEREFFG